MIMCFTCKKISDKENSVLRIENFWITRVNSNKTKKWSTKNHKVARAYYKNDDYMIDKCQKLQNVTFVKGYYAKLSGSENWRWREMTELWCPKYISCNISISSSTGLLLLHKFIDNWKHIRNETMDSVFSHSIFVQ